MPRFVVLEHDHPLLHWDLMLEAGGALRTWRLLCEPACGESVAAEPLPDHRLAYLEFEGPISGNRGSVKRWDAGEYRLLDESEERIVIDLSGKRLTGSVVIATGDAGWQFTFPGVR